MAVKRIEVTEDAKQVIHQLVNAYGALMFYQAGGCCEGSQPQCFRQGEFFPRMNDAMIGKVEGFEFWVDRDLFEYWKNTHFTLGVKDGYGSGGFSLEVTLGKTFHIDYRLFSQEELDQLPPVMRHT